MWLLLAPLCLSVCAASIVSLPLAAHWNGHEEPYTGLVSVACIERQARLVPSRMFIDELFRDTDLGKVYSLLTETARTAVAAWALARQLEPAQYGIPDDNPVVRLHAAIVAGVKVQHELYGAMMPLLVARAVHGLCPGPSDVNKTITSGEATVAYLVDAIRKGVREAIDIEDWYAFMNAERFAAVLAAVSDIANDALFAFAARAAVFECHKPFFEAAISAGRYDVAAFVLMNPACVDDTLDKNDDDQSMDSNDLVGCMLVTLHRENLVQAVLGLPESLGVGFGLASFVRLLVHINDQIGGHIDCALAVARAALIRSGPFALLEELAMVVAVPQVHSVLGDEDVVAHLGLPTVTAVKLVHEHLLGGLKAHKSLDSTLMDEVTAVAESRGSFYIAAWLKSERGCNDTDSLHSGSWVLTAEAANLALTLHNDSLGTLRRKQKAVEKFFANVVNMTSGALVLFSDTDDMDWVTGIEMWLAERNLTSLLKARGSADFQSLILPLGAARL